MMNSEYKPLQGVLLHTPGREISDVENPAGILHKSRIDHRLMAEEYALLRTALKKMKIEVHDMDAGPVEGADARSVFNLMYCRDLFFITPAGAIPARMATNIRKDEVKFAQRTLKRLGVPVSKVMDERATFEGADALWVHERLVVVGVGHRTNMAGYVHIRDALRKEGIRCIPVPSTQKVTQHLLGVLQFVDARLVLARRELMDDELVSFLNSHHIRRIDIPETEEVRERQAMNILTVAPGTIIMGANCPDTKKRFESAKVRVAAEVPISQLIRGGGGLACAVAPLRRAHG